MDRNNAAADVTVDTTRGSLLHSLSVVRKSRRSSGGPSGTRIYCTAALATFPSLVLAALMGTLPLAKRTSELRLPILFDFNIAFMFLLSFPALLVLLLRDDFVLNDALRRVQRDGTLTVNPTAARTIAHHWERKFRAANIVGQSLGLACSAIIVRFNYVAYANPTTGYWIANKSGLEPVGYLFMLLIGAFYFVIPLYFCRVICTHLFLKEVVSNATMSLLPFHPDRSGGLRPVGRIGLRNQYALSVLGLNIVSLVAVSILYLSVPRSLYGLILSAVIAYLCLGPIVFLSPLLPFRDGMLRAKSELMHEIAQRLRLELLRLRAQLREGVISKDDEELIERLRGIGRVAGELPVWPFDSRTLRQFMTVYVLPAVGALAYPSLSSILSWLGINADI
jgi:hypothetical protein